MTGLRDGYSWGELLERSLIPVSVAAAFFFVVMGASRSVWLDEASSILIAREGLQELISRLKNTNNLPAYYVLLHGWIAAFGDTEMPSRILSGIFYWATAPIVVFAGRYLTSSNRAGLYCAFFYLISTQAIHQAQNIRMYSLLGLLAALSICFLVRLLHSEKVRAVDIALFESANAIGCFTHMWFFFLFFSEIVVVISFAAKRRLSILSWSMAPVALFALLWLPILRGQLKTGAADWMPSFQWEFVPDALFRFYGGTSIYPREAILFYSICLILPFPALKWNPLTWLRDRRFLAVLVIFVCSLWVPLTVSVIKPIYWPDRYTIIALPALTLLTGGAMARLAPRPLLVVFCYALLAWQTGMIIQAGDLQKSDRETADFIVKNVPKGDVLVFTSLSRPAVDYYLEHFGHRDSYQETSFPSEIDLHPTWRSGLKSESHRKILEAEARRLVRQWERSGARSVWLLYGFDLPISEILKEEMEKTFVVHNQVFVSGPWHTSILQYNRKVP